jgi:hypothetical protein
MAIAKRANAVSFVEKARVWAARIPAARPRVGRIRGSLKEMGGGRERQISRKGAEVAKKTNHKDKM